MPQTTIENGDHPVVRKLGIARKQRVEVSGDIGTELRKKIRAQLGRGLVRSGELDGAIALVQSLEEAEQVLDLYLPRLRGDGYLWLVTHKAGYDSYINQMKLIPFAKRRGLIDNKTCSIDEARSAIRFMTPRTRRRPKPSG
jgi:hypothetical protein